MNSPQLVLVAAALAATACLAPAVEAPAVSARLVTDTTPEVAEVRRLGESAINRLAGSLLREVTTATAKGGPEGAVEVCHLRSLPITHGTVAGLPRITAVKRTSLKLRSPSNAPDAAEQQVLAHIDRLLARGDVPPSLLVQRVEPAQAAPEWRVYKPVAVAPACLQCHGDPAAQSETLRAKLKQYYPDDQAVGYKAGEWRGVIRVTVADAPAK